MSDHYNCYLIKEIDDPKPAKPHSSLIAETYSHAAAKFTRSYPDYNGFVDVEDPNNGEVISFTITDGVVQPQWFNHRANILGQT